jgi:hypothetical protein
MRYLKLWVLALLALVLVACGGGGNPGATSGSTPVVSTAATVEVLASALTLGSADNTTGVTITARVKDASNNALTGTAVKFSATSGVLIDASLTTNSSTGVATAVLMPGSNQANRNITVTVTSGSVSNTVVVVVSGSSLAITGSSSLLTGASAAFSLALKDASGVAIPSTPLTVVSSLGNTLSGAPWATDSTGGAGFTYTATNAGSDTLTVTGAGATATYSVTVSGSDFTFVTPSDAGIVTTGALQAVSVLYKNSSGVVQSGVPINFSTTRGTMGAASAITNTSGIASTTVTSTTAGAATLTAQVSGGAAITRAITFTGGTPTSIVLQLSSTAVAPNTTGSTANSVTLTATVKDANSNLVSGAIVNFSVESGSGDIKAGSATATTNASGVATSTYISGTSTTAANGVTLKAAVSGSSINSTASLTVSGSAVAITIGTGNTITVLDSTTYSKPFSVSINDANGVAVANQSVVLSLYATYYLKGELAYSGSSWGYSVTPTACANEDLNSNNTLDSGEDTNTDGVLWPGKPASLAASPVTTGSSGYVVFNVLYPKSYADWVVYSIKATATVAGTESSANYTYVLRGVASDYSSATVAPSSVYSPFGQATVCTSPL